MNEQCWVLIFADGEREGNWRVKRRKRVRGKPASVEADWAWALAREEQYGDVAGFFHTHPPGAGTSPSARDVRTMRAWCCALGKPLLCLIAEGAQVDGYVFTDDESEGRRLENGDWSLEI
jgi:proteasome lid subunit RPN8/RPN11